MGAAGGGSTVKMKRCFQMKPFIFTVSYIAVLLFVTGCSVNRWATAKLSDVLTGESSTVFTGEEDIALARDAFPFTLKLYETMLQRDSANPELLCATGKLFTLYAQAFVLMPADTLPPQQAEEAKLQRKRAKRLLLRGREYALRAFMAAHPEAPPLAGKGAIDTVLENTTAADTAFLYWSAAAWLGAAAADRADLGLAMSVRKPVAMLNRLCELDDGFDRGAAHEILAVFAAAAPKAIGGGETAAREHFAKAVSFSGGKKLSPYVSFAASMSIKTGNRTEFTDLLRKALDLESGNDRSLRLQNALYRERARYLLAQVDAIFPPAAVPADSTAGVTGSSGED